MKALLVTHSNGGGGAGRATQRLFQALDDSGVQVAMYSDFKHGTDSRITTHDSPLGRLARRARITIEEVPAWLAGHPQPELFSPGLCSAQTARSLNNSDADIINVHWTGYGTASIKSIGAIAKPMVWTLHDMWAFTGGLGYDDESQDARWRTGYNSSQSLSAGKYWDVERWVSNRKIRHWRHPINLVTPSHWLGKLASESYLLSDSPVTVIPNALDTELFRPVEKAKARHRFSIPEMANVIVVALGGDLHDPRKGFDLLQQALALLSDNDNLILAVVGPSEPPQGWPQLSIPTRWLGRLSDDDMVLAYNSADLVVLPSRQDNLPQTGTEPQACGIPVVAFNIGGLPDVVEHTTTGYLAEAGNVNDLARGIGWVLGESETGRELGLAARIRAVELWSSDVVGASYRRLFEELVAESAR